MPRRWSPGGIHAGTAKWHEHRDIIAMINRGDFDDR